MSSSTKGQEITRIKVLVLKTINVGTEENINCGDISSLTITFIKNFVSKLVLLN